MPVSGEHDLRVMLASLQPRLLPDDYVFAVVAPSALSAALVDCSRALIRENEGVTLVLTKKDADQHANTGGSGSEGEEDDGGNEHCNEAGESDIQTPETKAGQKRKASGGKPKTPAHQGTSTPASKNSKDASMQGSAKQFKGALVFEELVKTEETTRQMELQVEAEKVRFNTKRVEAKMQREKIKMEHEKNKLELLRLKLEIHKEQAKANQHPIHAPPIVDPLFQVALPSSSSFASGSQTPMSHHSHLLEGAYSFGGLEMGNGMSDST